MKVKRKANAFIYIAAATVLSLSLFAGLGNSATSAHADAAGDNYFERTDVLDDLDAMTVDGKDASFSLDGADDGVKVISLLEYCYSAVGQNEQYGLYLYIHAQDYVALESSSQLNKITLSYDGGERYKKYAIKYLNENSTPEEVGKFYKYKVNFTAAERAEVLKGVDRAKREYRVSEIELKQPRQSKATAYYVATNYRYTGFANGYGGGVSTAGLKCEQQELDTVELDVRSTYYRYPQTLSSGVQINSVYFAIDNKYLSRYGTLYKIWAEYERRDLAPIVVTDNQNAYNWLHDVAPADLNAVDENGKYFVFRVAINGGVPTPGSVKNWSDWVYGKGWKADILGQQIIMVGNYARRTKRLLSFYTTQAAQTCDISREELMNEIERTAELYGEEYVYDDGQGYTQLALTKDDLFNIKGFNTSAGFAEWFYGLLHKFDVNGDIENIEPIYEIKQADLSKTNLCDELLIAEEDEAAFKSFCNTAMDQDKTVWLFRYGTTEYSQHKAYIVPSGVSIFQGSDSQSLRFETIDRNFDIIQLGFKNDKQLVIIPVAASPIDVIGGSISNETTLYKLNGGGIIKDFADDVGGFISGLIKALKELFANIGNWWWIPLVAIGGVGAVILIISIISKNNRDDVVVNFDYGASERGKNGRKKTTKRR